MKYLCFNFESIRDSFFSIYLKIGELSYKKYIQKKQ